MRQNMIFSDIPVGSRYIAHSCVFEKTSDTTSTHRGRIHVPKTKGEATMFKILEGKADLYDLVLYEDLLYIITVVDCVMLCISDGSNYTYQKEAERIELCVPKL